MSDTMKAIRQHAFGGPDVLVYEDAPKPQPKEGEVLVRVHAVGINPPDWYLRDGYSALPPEWRPQVSFPLILGTDISGVVEAVADDVERFSVGDEVYSMVRFPGDLTGGKAYAEYVCVSASELALKPAGIDHVHAPDHAVTTWRQFFIHLAIVSIGLLIALSLESLVEAYHHRSLVTEARRNIEREISENRGLVKQNIASVQADQARMSFAS